MIINFKEIPKANKGSGEQDRFEQFACDFLETIGFKIIRRPDRGPDGKKDLIVSETRKGVGGETNVKWLVSCKHNAHSGASVKDIDEEDIQDRVTKHKCQGFIGFYSTLPSSSLSDKLFALTDKIECTTYDSTRIEKELLRSNQKDRILASYFPLSHDKYRQQKSKADFPDNSNSNDNIRLKEEDVLRITKTAIILLEIEKIREEYYNDELTKRENSLYKLYRFTDHSNELVASAIFQFLQSVADGARARMPSNIAGSIYSLTLTFFPSSVEKEREVRIDNGKRCLSIGFSLTYDAFIYLSNFKIAGYGLSIWKFIYREGKRNKMPELVEAVLLHYKELEEVLNRPERMDLENAKQLVKIFKDDLETPSLSFPILNDYLYQIMMEDNEK